MCVIQGDFKTKHLSLLQAEIPSCVCWQKYSFSAKGSNRVRFCVEESPKTLPIFEAEVLTCIFFSGNKFFAGLRSNRRDHVIQDNFNAKRTKHLSRFETDETSKQFSPVFLTSLSPVESEILPKEFHPPVSASNELNRTRFCNPRQLHFHREVRERILSTASKQVTHSTSTGMGLDVTMFFGMCWDKKYFGRDVRTKRFGSSPKFTRHYLQYCALCLCFGAAFLTVTSGVFCVSRCGKQTPFTCDFGGHCRPV